MIPVVIRVLLVLLESEINLNIEETVARDAEASCRVSYYHDVDVWGGR